MHDYQREDPGWAGDRRRGASMGRLCNLDYEVGDRLTIRRVPLDEGGYDPGGAYWGRDKPLFCVSKDEFVTYLRATSFEDAKLKFPGAHWVRVFSSGDLEDMIQGYAECILATTDEYCEGEEDMENDATVLIHNHTIDDFSKEAMDSIRRDCEAFIKGNAGTMVNLVLETDVDWFLLGHDFWLERSGFGGFDSGWPQRWSESLQSACQGWGECHFYVNADGQIVTY